MPDNKASQEAGRNNKASQPSCLPSRQSNPSRQCHDRIPDERTLWLATRQRNGRNLCPSQRPRCRRSNPETKRNHPNNCKQWQQPSPHRPQRVRKLQRKERPSNHVLHPMQNSNGSQ